MTVAGALGGGTLKPVSRYGDLENVISIQTAAVYGAKDLFKESSPFYKEYNTDGFDMFITYHFLTEMRKQLSGDIEDGVSNFGKVELQFYTDYNEWVDGTSKSGDLLVAILKLDKWLVDEIQELDHPTVERSYDENHKWNKTLTRA